MRSPLPPRPNALLLVLSLASALPACVGTTGGDVFAFEAYASGPPGADGTSYAFETQGYAVTLDRAELQLGAAYLNRAVPTSGSGPSTTCTLAGTYSAEVPAELLLDALSPEPQPFPALGHATSDPSHTGEVWLNQGDIDDPNTDAPVLDVAGSAEKDGVSRRFRGTLTIGSNRLDTAPPQSPGLYPICKERIVTPIAVDLVPRRDGHLLLTVDPARMFTNVDFEKLTKVDADGTLVFDDARETADHPVDDASKKLYLGLRSTNVYRFSWSND
jgi:hypothetical protein